MAELKIKFTGDGSDAVKAAQATRQQIVEQFAQAGQEVGKQTIAPDFDTVFGQLTQFRIGLTQIARGDLGGVPNLIKGIQLAGTQVSEIAPKLATASQAFKIFDSAVAQSGSALSSKDLFGNFRQSIEDAALGGSKSAERLRVAFTKMGIDLTQALADPQKAFRDFLKIIGSEDLKQNQLKTISSIFRQSSDEVRTAAINAGKAVNDFDGAQVAAAASTQKLTGGLSLMTIGIGAAAAAAAATGAALLLLGDRAASAADNIRKIQEETGLSVETIQRFKAAATILDVDLKTVTGAYKSFKDSTTEARLGNEEVLKSFRILGITAKEAAENPQQAFNELVIAISKLGDEGIRTKTAQNLLKLSAGELAGVYKVLTEDSGRLTDELNKSARVMSVEAIKAAEEYGKEVRLLKQDFDDLANSIGITVLPVLRGLVSFLNEPFTPGKNSILAALLSLSGVTGIVAGLKAIRSAGQEAGGAFIDFGNSVSIAKKATTAADEALKNLYTNRAKQAARKDPASENLLRESENALRSVDEQYRTFNDQLQQRLNERIISEQTYTKKLIEGAQERLRATSVLLDQEEATIAGANFDPNKRQQELLKVQRQREKLEEETARSIEKINSDSRVRERQATEQFQREILNTLATTNDRKIALIEDQVEREILTNEEGQARINELLLEGIRRRITAQEAIVNSFPQGSSQAILEAEKVKQLQIELGAAEEAALIRSRNARQRDIRARRDYLAELQGIQNDIADAQVGQLEDNADRNVNASVLAIQARAEIERQLILQQAQVREQALQDQLARNQIERDDDFFTQLSKIANAERITELLTAEAERRRELLKRINDREAKDLQAQNKTLKDVQKNSRDAIANGLAGSIAAYANGASSIRQAAASFYDAALQPLTDYLNKKAVAYFQESVARFAIGDYIGGAKYGLAGAAMAAAAGFVGSGGFVSGAIAGGGSSGGNSPLGQSLTGTRQDENTVPTDNRFRYYEAGRIVTEIRIVTDQEQMVKNVSTAVVRDYNQGGMTRKIIRKETAGEPIY